MSVPRGAQIDCQIEHSERIGDINEAWRFLSNHANQLSGKSDISPEDLILGMYQRLSNAIRFITFSS
jgi:hypothetical protein